MKIPNAKLNKNITVLTIMADKKENKHNKINLSKGLKDALIIFSLCAVTDLKGSH